MKTVTLNGKTYAVQNGWITVTWAQVVPSTASSARPRYMQRRATVDPSGRLGKRILSLASGRGCK